jgi:hypothetical protein
VDVTDTDGEGRADGDWLVAPALVLGDGAGEGDDERTCGLDDEDGERVAEAAVRFLFRLS